MASERYNPRVAEAHWQKIWEENQTFETDNSDPRENTNVQELSPYRPGPFPLGTSRPNPRGDGVAR